MRPANPPGSRPELKGIAAPASLSLSLSLSLCPSVRTSMCVREWVCVCVSARAGAHEYVCACAPVRVHAPVSVCACARRVRLCGADRRAVQTLGSVFDTVGRYPRPVTKKTQPLEYLARRMKVGRGLAVWHSCEREPNQDCIKIACHPALEGITLPSGY